MTRYLLTAAAGAAMLAASPAMAQTSFDGPHAGLKLGFGSSTYDVDASSGNAAGSFDGVGGEGFSTGVRLGYGRTYPLDQGRLYLGGEVEGNVSFISAEADGRIGSASADAEVTENYSGIASLRVGVLPADNWMIFGRGGLGVTQTELDASTSTGFSSSDEDEKLTYLIGAGIEGFVSNNVSLRLDYSYRIQDDYDFGGAGTSIEVSPSTSVAEISVNFYF